MKDSDFTAILEKIYRERGFDFRQYKETSLERRLQKRLRALNLNSYKDYLVRLSEDPAECDRLIDVLLINVTEFFRDRDAFDIIRDKVLPDIMAGKTGERPELKIWSAGCATGEEAYSMAILLNEMLGNKTDNFGFSICGTDIDKDSLEKAKDAAYKIDMVDGKIADEILDKYFVMPQLRGGDDCRLQCCHSRESGNPVSVLNISGFPIGSGMTGNIQMAEGLQYFVRDGSLNVKDSVRRNCFFLFHDLVLDKPLKAMDIILCRNVAIYFERALQEKIYMDFSCALNEKGYLFLGKAETLIGPAQERFEVLDKRWKIYKKRNFGAYSSPPECDRGRP